MSKGAKGGGYLGGSFPQAEAPFSMPFELGEVIAGKYEITGLLGAGGMGFVVSATHLDLGEAVALKFLRPEALVNDEIVARFAREARAAARIQSEYVARVFDVGNLPDGAPFIVMEHLDGKDLNELVNEQGALAPKLAVEYLLQACEALASAHANGIVHRDIKPENLFLTHRVQGMDIIKVLDFGISKVALTGSAFESRLPKVQTMAVMGSPLYMSPEQIRASEDVDARTDIWSLGCVLYELLTAQAAFDAPSLTAVSATILEKNPVPVCDLTPTVPPELELVVSRCIEKDPAKRYQNVAELAIALYPFAPRRARISAERCCYVLKSAGMTQAEFELPSMHPPSWNGSNSGIAIPVNGRESAPISNPRVSLEPELASRAKKAGRGGLWLGATLGVFVGAFGLWHYRSGSLVASADNSGRPVSAAPPPAPPPRAPRADPLASTRPAASVNGAPSARVSNTSSSSPAHAKPAPAKPRQAPRWVVPRRPAPKSTSGSSGSPGGRRPGRRVRHPSEPQIAAKWLNRNMARSVLSARCMTIFHAPEPESYLLLPRERGICEGFNSLADAELVSVLLGTGERGRSAVRVAAELLERCGGVTGLSRVGPHAAAEVRGVGPRQSGAVGGGLRVGAATARPRQREQARQHGVFGRGRTLGSSASVEPRSRAGLGARPRRSQRASRGAPYRRRGAARLLGRSSRRAPLCDSRGRQCLRPGA